MTSAATASASSIAYIPFQPYIQHDLKSVQTTVTTTWTVKWTPSFKGEVMTSYQPKLSERGLEYLLADTGDGNEHGYVSAGGQMYARAKVASSYFFIENESWNGVYYFQTYNLTSNPWYSLGYSYPAPGTPTTNPDNSKTFTIQHDVTIASISQIDNNMPAQAVNAIATISREVRLIEVGGQVVASDF